MTSTQPSSNPRRGYKTGVPPTASLLHSPTTHHAQLHINADIDRSLKKSATFHSPKSPASDDDPIVNIPLLSRRSPTSHQELEDAVAAADEQRYDRIARLLGNVDRSLSGLQIFAADSQEAVRPDEHPIPRFMRTAIDDQDHMDIDTPRGTKYARHNRHTSDSGIGSSVTDSDDIVSRDAAIDLAEYKKSIPSLIHHIQSSINGATGNTHALSAYACRQIQKYLIVPILKEETLKNFHPLVSGIPVRVGRKEITCLRDLEKVLLWLAPRFSVSRSAFLNFCETSIQCLHTAVEHLNESDQRRPADRPYTNTYFVDLTEQVRQYAAMIGTARSRMAAGMALEGDEGISNSKLSLEDGLAHTGRPAQFVTTANGRSISLRTGQEVDLEALREGRSRSGSHEIDEEILLSMARRRKAAAEKVAQRCRECDKEFKRPCDLTKHEKTHSRPWKCSEQGCKYATFGWPTEKERDRHVNDKHSVMPSMYKCQFHPCPYSSKRESNCKQHMEKAHGWAYVRSKNNGRGGKRQSKTTKSPPTPQMTTPGSNIFDAGSDFGDSSASPYMHSRSGSTTNGSIAGASPFLNNQPYPSPYEPNFTFDPPTQTLTPQSPYTPTTHRLSIDSTAMNNRGGLPSSYDPSNAEFDQPLFGETFDWSNMDTDFTSMNIQLYTPATSIGSHPMEAYHSRNPSISLQQSVAPNAKLSPGAQGAMMLFSPNDEIEDEGFNDFMTTDMGKPTNDFALFDDAGAESSMGQGSMNLFQGLPQFQSQTWVGNSFDGMEE